MRQKVLVTLVLTVILALFVFSIYVWAGTLRNSENQQTLNDVQALSLGRSFLDERNYVTGKVINQTLQNKEPNCYWNELFALQTPDIMDLRLCWVIRFEQAASPGHFFEVWVDASTSEIIGGTQCR